MENKLEKRVIDLFQYHHNLKFSEIESLLKIRSNKLAYHIKNLIKKGILLKKYENYNISDSSEHLIPYLSEKSSMLPVILIHIGDKNNAFLWQRNKRPYKDMLSMPGGRILLGEYLKQAVARIMKIKFNINAKFNKINSISFEHVKKNKKIIHSFILIFVSAETKDNIKLTNMKKNNGNIIPSDYKLLREDLNKEIDIKTIFSRA